MGHALLRTINVWRLESQGLRQRTLGVARTHFTLITPLIGVQRTGTGAQLILRSLSWVVSAVCVVLLLWIVLQGGSDAGLPDTDGRRAAAQPVIMDGQRDETRIAEARRHSLVEIRQVVPEEGGGHEVIRSEALDTLGPVSDSVRQKVVTALRDGAERTDRDVMERLQDADTTMSLRSYEEALMYMFSARASAIAAQLLQEDAYITLDGRISSDILPPDDYHWVSYGPVPLQSGGKASILIPIPYRNHDTLRALRDEQQRVHSAVIDELIDEFNRQPSAVRRERVRISNEARAEIRAIIQSEPASMERSRRVAELGAALLSSYINAREPDYLARRR